MTTEAREGSLEADGPTRFEQAEGAPAEGESTKLEPLSAADPTHWFERDPLWFKRAIFYEIHMRGFYDGNDDGSGDFVGLTEKLDYLQWLGVDCIWLLPMFP
ncbi:MAG: maltose alpha-D-glucosyltransferase / alpha-amylase, partial [Baekduia sp.]|nr:maltose alpha-D-glucosyltransferase / alpha-amylase [Baekduia sp.]